ncbi:hypothetical protein GIB67_007639 [Kingdonia uniflora]|uniref:PTC1-like winged helix-turn-helix domain-containing protein n=1 Tax=Kingdonia uniflora TaxID=39325 RepID=A0A7J7N252_9MAGN|nr:hypothetical protein GIB67_007639 [Kingdonia uniflora]
MPGGGGLLWYVVGLVMVHLRVDQEPMVVEVDGPRVVLLSLEAISAGCKPGCCGARKQPTYQGMTYEEVEEVDDDYYQMVRFNYMVTSWQRYRDGLHLLAYEAVTAVDKAVGVHPKKSRWTRSQRARHAAEGRLSIKVVKLYERYFCPLPNNVALLEWPLQLDRLDDEVRRVEFDHYFWKITVEDSSVKRSMDLRLLFGVAYGHSWFGRWGYKFYHGSFGVTKHNYEAAIWVLSSLNIDNVLEDLGRESRDKLVKEIVYVYREMSDTQLTMIIYLIKFMLTVKSRAPVQRKIVTKPPPPAKAIKPRKSLKKNNKPTKYKKFKSFISEMDSRWPKRRLEYAAEVIIEVLKELQGGMSRQEVRDAARLHIGDTGLLDFVIKSINNYIVGNYVVLRTLNPVGYEQ